MKLLVFLYIIIADIPKLLAIAFFLSVLLLWAEVVPSIHFHTGG